LAKPNYSFQKRQKELSKKAKKEEKRQRKQGKSLPDPDDNVIIEDNAYSPLDEVKTS
jgi:hypothetical protein